MTEDQAKQRFMLLNLVRLFALVMLLAGAANIGGKLLPDLSPMLGYVLVFGAADFFLAPALLKRHWQNQDK